MKKSELKKLILEAVEDVKQEKEEETDTDTSISKDEPTTANNELKDAIPDGVVDKLGPFFIVSKPANLDKNTDLKSMVTKVNVFYLLQKLSEGFQSEEIVGIFKSKSEANKLGNEILKKFKSGIKEAETQAKQYKELKSQLKEKLKALKQ